MSKLNLDRDKIQASRDLAKRITQRVSKNIAAITTNSIERASLRLLGVEDAYNGMPVVNLILDSIPAEERGKGLCYWFGRGLATQRSSPIALALRVAGGKLKLTELPEASKEEIQRALAPLLKSGMERLQAAARHKRDVEARWTTRSRPLKFVNVGTGDIEQDRKQAVAAAKAGADCVGVSRSAGQSLMDYIPQGETHSGHDGTFFTQANMQLLRKDLNETAEQLKQAVRLVANGTGLCMPEIAVIGSFEHLDYLICDALYGVLFRDINIKRAFADQFFARRVLAHSGIIINTSENHFMAHAESYRIFPHVLASLFMNEQFSFLSELREWQMGFTHAFEMDPALEDGFLYEVAQAQMVRECFPKAPIHYAPPTRHKTGDIFFSHLMDGLFAMVGAMTHQDIQELGTATEAIHHPLLMDRYWSLKAANYVLSNTRSLGDEIQWSLNGKVVRRARSVLDGAYRLLQKIEKSGGLFQAISKGYLGNIPRQTEQGIGTDGIITRSDDYLNPVMDALIEQSKEEIHIAPASHRRYSTYRSMDRDRSGRPERSPRRDSRDSRGPRRDQRDSGDSRGPRRDQRDSRDSRDSRGPQRDSGDSRGSRRGRGTEGRGRRRPEPERKTEARPQREEAQEEVKKEIPEAVTQPEKIPEPAAITEEAISESESPETTEEELVEVELEDEADAEEEAGLTADDLEPEPLPSEEETTPVEEDSSDRKES